MTSKIVSNSNKIKKILTPSPLKIVILLSIIIIIILIYLKINNKELFTTVANVNEYFRKYFATQDLYKTIQNQLDRKEDTINELSNDIQTVLSGKILTPKTTSSTEETNTDSAQGINTESSSAKRNRCPSLPKTDSTPTINCSVYYDTDIGLPNQCLTELWKGVGCTNLSVTDNFPSGGWWKTQPKKIVHDDMKEWARINDISHRQQCYGPNATLNPTTTSASNIPNALLSSGSNSQCVSGITNPNIRTVRSNNGTVNCNTYCRGTGGRSWNDELPAEWQGAKCVGTNDIQNGCNSKVLGVRPANNPLTCECQRDDGMKYNKEPNVKTVYSNNGTVNCNTYCRGTGGKSWNDELPPEWKGARCLRTNDPAGCTSSYLTQRTGLTCDCQQDDSTPWYN